MPAPANRRPLPAPASHDDPPEPEVTDEDIPGGSQDAPEPPPDDDAPDPRQTTPPEDLLALHRDRAAIFGESIRKTRGARVQFCDEFEQLSAVQLVTQRIVSKGIPPNDPICILIEVCGLFDFRQRELLVAFGAILGHHEDAMKAFLNLLESHVAVIQDSRALTERTGLLLDATNQRLADTHQRIDELGLFLRAFMRSAEPLARRLEVAANILDTKSHAAILLNWAIPVVTLLLAVALDRLLFR